MNEHKAIIPSELGALTEFDIPDESLIVNVTPLNDARIVIHAITPRCLLLYLQNDFNFTVDTDYVDITVFPDILLSKDSCLVEGTFKCIFSNIKYVRNGSVISSIYPFEQSVEVRDSTANLSSIVIPGLVEYGGDRYDCILIKGISLFIC